MQAGTLVKSFRISCTPEPHAETCAGDDMPHSGWCAVMAASSGHDRAAARCFSVMVGVCACGRRQRHVHHAKALRRRKGGKQRKLCDPSLGVACLRACGARGRNEHRVFALPHSLSLARSLRPVYGVRHLAGYASPPLACDVAYITL